MSAESKAQAHRRLTIPLDQVEAEYGRERRLASEVIRSQCVGGDREAGRRAARELGQIRAGRVPAA